MALNGAERAAYRLSADADRHWPLRLGIIALELFVGVVALHGGFAMLRDPLYAMDATTDLITGSPFDTLTGPGALLLVLAGLAPLMLCVGLVARVPGAIALSAWFGVGLLAWVVVQWAVVQWAVLTEQLWLQPVIFGIGAVILVLAATAHRHGAR